MKVRSIGMIFAGLVALGVVNAAGIAGQGTWETTLQARDLDRDGVADAYYDTALNISWVANADVAGPLSWQMANLWASSLDVHGVIGWRLPKTTDYSNGTCANVPALLYYCSDFGWNVNTEGSELAHMYFVTLGNKALFDTNGIPQVYGLTNTANFQNLRSGTYWSETEYAPMPTNAWIFGTDAGPQTTSAKDSPYYAWAVHQGDVAAVPEPHSALLALTALGVLVAANRHRRRD